MSVHRRYLDGYSGLLTLLLGEFKIIRAALRGLMGAHCLSIYSGLYFI